MTSGELLIQHSSPRSIRRRGTRCDRIVARLLAPQIDRDVAQGTPSWSTPTHPARAMQLTSSRSRHSLELLVERAEQRAPSSMSAAVALCREQVRNALPEIRAISAWLRTAERSMRGASRCCARS